MLLLDWLALASSRQDLYRACDAWMSCLVKVFVIALWCVTSGFLFFQRITTFSLNFGAWMWQVDDIQGSKFILKCDRTILKCSSVDNTSDFNDHDIKIKQQLKPKERSDLGFFLDFVIWNFGQKKKKGGEKITQTKSEEPKHRPVDHVWNMWDVSPPITNLSTFFFYHPIKTTLLCLLPFSQVSTFISLTTTSKLFLFCVGIREKTEEDKLINGFDLSVKFSAHTATSTTYIITQSMPSFLLPSSSSSLHFFTANLRLCRLRSSFRR